MGDLVRQHLRLHPINEFNRDMTLARLLQLRLRHLHPRADIGILKPHQFLAGFDIGARWGGEGCDETLRAGAHFSLIPLMVAQSLLVLTTGRQYCERYTEVLPLKVLPCPIEFPRMMYYQLWHERTHASSSARWLRDCIKSVAASLRAPGGAAKDIPCSSARKQKRIR